MENSLGKMIETTRNKQAAFYFWIHSAFRKYIEVSMDLILVGLVLVTFVFIMKTVYLLAQVISGRQIFPM
jgi:hypothetical protein